MKKQLNSIPLIIIGLVFVLLIGINWNNYAYVAQNVVWKFQGNADVEAKENISAILKDNFKFRSAFIDIYGLTKKMLGENIIGKYEYYAAYYKC